MPALTIFIQDRTSKKLLKSPRTWARTEADARTFPTALSAFYFAAEHQLRNVEVVCMKKKPGHQVATNHSLAIASIGQSRCAAPIPAHYAEWPETVLRRHQHRSS